MVKWRRYRFKTHQVADYRPLVFNPSYPWWCSGYEVARKDLGSAILIAFLPEGEQLDRYWDDAFEVESNEAPNGPFFTDRFPRPDYYVPLEVNAA